MLSGRPPFIGDTAMATIQRRLRCEADRPRGIDPIISRDSVTILRIIQHTADLVVPQNLRKWFGKRELERMTQAHSITFIR